jgi:hypothetical protein
VSKAEQLVALARVHELLVRHRIEYWLFGGWAVDFHAGAITRPTRRPRHRSVVKRPRRDCRASRRSRFSAATSRAQPRSVKRSMRSGCVRCSPATSSGCSRSSSGTAAVWRSSSRRGDGRAPPSREARRGGRRARAGIRALRAQGEPCFCAAREEATRRASGHSVAMSACRYTSGAFTSTPRLARGRRSRSSASAASPP